MTAVDSASDHVRLRQAWPSLVLATVGTVVLVVAFLGLTSGKIGGMTTFFAVWIAGILIVGAVWPMPLKTMSADTDGFWLNNLPKVRFAWFDAFAVASMMAGDERVLFLVNRDRRFTLVIELTRFGIRDRHEAWLLGHLRQHVPMMVDRARVKDLANGWLSDWWGAESDATHVYVRGMLKGRDPARWVHEAEALATSV